MTDGQFSHIFPTEDKQITTKNVLANEPNVAFASFGPCQRLLDGIYFFKEGGSCQLFAIKRGAKENLSCPVNTNGVNLVCDDVTAEERNP